MANCCHDVFAICPVYRCGCSMVSGCTLILIPSAGSRFRSSTHWGWKNPERFISLSERRSHTPLMSRTIIREWDVVTGRRSRRRGPAPFISRTIIREWDCHHGVVGARVEAARPAHPGQLFASGVSLRGRRARVEAVHPAIPGQFWASWSLVRSCRGAFTARKHRPERATCCSRKPSASRKSAEAIPGEIPGTPGRKWQKIRTIRTYSESRIKPNVSMQIYNHSNRQQ